jgi:putative endopeptidase
MDTNRLERLGFRPIEKDLRRVTETGSMDELLRLAAELKRQSACSAFFEAGVEPDEKDTRAYIVCLSQGGLGMPERDYYLENRFAKERVAYVEHITRMLNLAGEKPLAAAAQAKLTLEMETLLATASKSSTDLRDPVANYHKDSVSEATKRYPFLQITTFLSTIGAAKANHLVVRQPEFFAALDGLVKDRRLDDWKVYVRWHVLRTAAPYLNRAAEDEAFAFNGKILSGQLDQEPRWQRSGRVLDRALGEDLGKIYVQKYFPPEARRRMNELVGDLRAVFRQRLLKVDWMSEATRAKAVAKIDRLVQKIGYPDKFRDYSAVEIRRIDYLGNVRRAALFDFQRRVARLDRPVDRTEWDVTPPTVDAYYNPPLNEIIFPAGILQPPFFDLQADDAVNYGAIGMVIGHEITHGFDDQGRQYDEDGNLKDWWTDKDAKEFEARAQRLVDQYGNYEALPQLKVNGKLTLGENIADLGGVTIAYDALQCALARDPSRRKPVDGFTPEQRFFLAVAQIWRCNVREEALRMRLMVDPHSPWQFRSIGPLVNLKEFYDAFNIKEGSPLWRATDARTKIW